MRIAIVAAAAVAALGLAACESKSDNAAEAKADAVEDLGEQKADALEDAGRDEAADAVEQKTDAAADAMEEGAGKKD